MRTPLLFCSLCCVILLTGCATRAPRVVPAPAPTFSLRPAHDASNSVSIAAERAKLAMLKKNYVEAAERLDEVLGAHQKLELALSQAEASAAKLQLWGIDQQTLAEQNAEGWRKSEAVVEKQKQDLKAYHRLKFICSAALGAGAGLAASQFLVPLIAGVPFLAPYLIWIPVALGLIIAAISFFKL